MLGRKSLVIGLSTSKGSRSLSLQWTLLPHFAFASYHLPGCTVVWSSQNVKGKKCQKEERNRTPRENKGSQLWWCFQLRIAHCQSCAWAAALWTVLSFNDKSNMMRVCREAINSALGGKVKATGRTPGVGKVGALGGTAILQCVPEPPPTAAWWCVSSEQVTFPSFHSKLQRLAWGQVPSPPPPPPHARAHTGWCLVLWPGLGQGRLWQAVLLNSFNNFPLNNIL